ncbi:MAG TPA: hypothetical protein PKE07_15455 [Lacibacter sp.]|nr:hypothetical protein [Lacibacter sp.]
MKHVLILFGFFLAAGAEAQLVEVYAGHERAGTDILWFKNFRNSETRTTPWLFFNRTRASVDYSNRPLWGATHAVSYNGSSGLGLVGVGLLAANGFTPKAGLQYFKQKSAFLFFGWLVADLKKQGNIDLFGLFRYQPAINDNWKWLSQVELFPVYSPHNGRWNLTQRIRLGAKYQSWGGGWMMDLNQTGKSSFVTTNNVGVFVRCEF